MLTAEARREELKAVYEQARGCLRCPQLAATRQSVVFGAGHADADLMFVGEAPGANEDKQGLPFVGQAGKLLEQLLGEIGLRREDVFIANVLKCLRYDALVQLGDGSWEQVGRLVGAGYAGTVMSVTADGRLEPRRVTGWHESPLGGRRVFRLSYANAKAAGAHRSGIWLTGDHPVLTQRGWVAAAELAATDRVATGQGVSELVRDVVCGTLLGDAGIAPRSAMLTFSHSAKQRDYAAFKVSLLKELRPMMDESQVAVVHGVAHDVIHARTRASRALRIMRADFYAGAKRVPAWLENELNPRMLAFWFLDDGHCRIREGGRRPCAEIAAHGFTEGDRAILVRALARLGVEGTSRHGRIVFGVDATRVLSTLIAPYVPPSMRHKLVPEVAVAIPFDAAEFAPGERIVMYDRVEIEDVTDRMGADTTFFCLDVEETANFVTSGGVVHNCRPPGNRDPLPGEIANCQDYLYRQLELIQPKVVCTLGNFSTKLLRADPGTGITRLHGREEIRTIGPRAVRLYPIYHPAAALYTRSLLEVLRADFARIPELLALEPPPQPEPVEAAEPVVHEPEELVAEIEEATAAEAPPERRPDDEQLGLF